MIAGIPFGHTMADGATAFGQSLGRVGTRASTVTDYTARLNKSLSSVLRLKLEMIAHGQVEFDLRLNI